MSRVPLAPAHVGGSAVRRLQQLSFGMLCAAAVVLSGCASTIANRMLAAPNGGCPPDLPRSVPLAFHGSAGIESQHIRVITLPVDGGTESLRGVVVEPSAAPLITPHAQPWHWQRAWEAPAAPPLATVVLLHGLWGSLDDQIGHAVALANAGYRCVLLDLRGHGQSSGKQLGYGRREALDVVEAIAQLRARKILTGRSALIGFSYGGGIALMAAARGAQTDVVVAVAPFAELHDVAGNFASELGGWLGWFSSPGLVASTLQLAGERGGFDAHRDSPLGAASAVQVPVLLIHGTKDTLVPLDESRKLQAALAGPTTLRTVAGRDHVELVYDAGLSLPVMLPWLADHLAPGAYGLLDHALVAWKGREPLSPFHATWAVRQQPTAEIHDWPRPAGGRCLRTWFQVPPAWLGRDLDLELGTIDGRDEAWLGAVRLGGMNELQPSPIPLLRRYRVPAWAVTAQCELSLLLISDHADAGLHWLCASTGLIRPASP